MTNENVINQQQHSILADINNTNIVPTEFERVRIASLNAQSLKKDENLGLAIEICKQFNIQIMGVQESWRIGSEYIEFGENEEKWKWINYGYEKKSRAGVGFILGPDVKVIKTVENLTGRILTVYVKFYGLCLRLINVYAPTEIEDTQTKQNFYSEVRKAMLVKELKKFKPLLVGDFNAVIADDSCDGFKSVLGLNNPYASIRTTNENGRLLLEFCQEHNLRIDNSQFKTKNIHRNTHTLPDGTVRLYPCWNPTP